MATVTYSIDGNTLVNDLHPTEILQGSSDSGYWQIPRIIVDDRYDVVHKDAVYTATNSYGMNIQIRVTNWSDYWSCGYWYHSCTVYVYFGLSGSISGDSVSSSNFSLYNDQTITVKIHNQLVLEIKAGNIRANATYSQSVNWYDNQTNEADIILTSANDDLPIRPKWSAVIGGATKEPGNDWWNLGSDGGTKLRTVSGNINWDIVRSKSGSLGISNSVREY